jgi:septum formation protein
MKLPIILASESPARLKLLAKIGITPDKVLPANINETELPGELPRKLADRLAFEKASSIAAIVDSGIIIGADTVPVAGRRIMRKARHADDIRTSLKLLSNRRHQIYTAVCVIKKTPDGTKISRNTVKSIIKFKKLTPPEIEFYCSLGEGIGKAGGYTVDGYAECFISFISGSFSNIIGLPLYETTNMLGSMGVYSFLPAKKE